MVSYRTKANILLRTIDAILAIRRLRSSNLYKNDFILCLSSNYFHKENAKIAHIKINYNINNPYPKLFVKVIKWYEICELGKQNKTESWINKMMHLQNINVWCVSNKQFRGKKIINNNKQFLKYHAYIYSIF